MCGVQTPFTRCMDVFCVPYVDALRVPHGCVVCAPRASPPSGPCIRSFQHPVCARGRTKHKLISLCAATCQLAFSVCCPLHCRLPYALPSACHLPACTLRCLLCCHLPAGTLRGQLRCHLPACSLPRSTACSLGTAGLASMQAQPLWAYEACVAIAASCPAASVPCRFHALPPAMLSCPFLLLGPFLTFLLWKKASASGTPSHAA